MLDIGKLYIPIHSSIFGENMQVSARTSKQAPEKQQIRGGVGDVSNLTRTTALASGRIIAESLGVNLDTNYDTNFDKANLASPMDTQLAEKPDSQRRGQRGRTRRIPMEEKNDGVKGLNPSQGK